MNLIKVWWHCLIRTLKSGHAQCSIQHYDIDGDFLSTEHFCECGYLGGASESDDSSKDLRTEVARLTNKRNKK